MAAEPPHLPKKNHRRSSNPKLNFHFEARSHTFSSLLVLTTCFSSEFIIHRSRTVFLFSHSFLCHVAVDPDSHQNEVLHIRPASHLILRSPGHSHRDASYQDQREHFAVHLHRRRRYHKQCWPRLVELHDRRRQWRRRIGKHQPKPGTRLRRGPERKRQRAAARFMRRVQRGQQRRSQHPMLLPAVPGVVPRGSGEERRGGKRAGREGRIQQRRWRPERRDQQAAGDGNAGHSAEPEWCWSRLPRCECAQLCRDAEDGRSCIQGVRAVDLGGFSLIQRHMRL